MKSRIEKHCDWDVTIAENIQYGKIAEGGHEVVIQLLIDDGVASRGHRTNIFKPELKFLGVGVSPHKKWTQCVCIDYAGGVVPYSKGIDTVKPKKGTKKIPTTKKVNQDVKPKSTTKGVTKSSAKSNAKNTTKGTTKSTKNAKKSKPVEESKIIGNDLIDLEDCPIDIQKQILAMNLEPGFKIRKSESGYNVEYVDTKVKKSKMPMSDMEQDMKAQHDEPKGYSKKSAKVKTQTCNGKTTKTTITEYTFPDGSVQTFTETLKY